MAPTTTAPAQWDLATLEREWHALSEEVAREAPLTMPAVRVRCQADLDGVVTKVVEEWPGLSGSEKVNAWERMCEAATIAAQHIAPMCVRSGDCCRASSPTLHPEDAELVRAERIPWNVLFTVRAGELARRPGEDQPVTLAAEQIKIREKAGSHECALFDSETNACSIYEDRPLQCRAQACWDGTPARTLLDQPRLSRRDLFHDVEPLLELLAAHEQRCSFVSLRQAVEALEQPTDENAAHLVEVIAFEDHFRTRMSADLNIPADTLDLILGRSFTELAHLLGFEVREEPDGTRTVVPRQ